MIIPDKKKAVSVILGRIGKKETYKDGGSIPMESEMSPHLEAKGVHAESIIDAMHNRDPKALVSAMTDFLREHELHEEQEEHEGKEDPDSEEESDYSPKED